MIGKFLNGALVGSVMAAAGLAAVSLVSPHKLVAPDLALDESVTAPETLEPDASEPSEAELAVTENVPAAVEPAPEDTADAVTAEPTPEPAPEVVADTVIDPPQAPVEPQEPVNVPALAADEVTKLTNDVLAALAPADKPPPLADPAPAIAKAEPVPALPAVPAKAAVAEGATAAATPIAPVEVEPAEKPAAETATTETAKPEAEPAETEPAEVAVAVDPPAQAEAGAATDDTLLAVAEDEIAPPASPEISDPAPVEPAPEVASTLPEPDAKPTEPAAADAPLVTAEAEPPVAAPPVPEPPVAEPPVADTPVADTPVIVEPEVVEPAPETMVPVAPPEDSLPGTVSPDMPGKKPLPLPGTEAAPEADAEVAVLPEPEAESGPTLKPAPGLGGTAEGVITGRLPRIGDQPAVVAEAEPGAAAPDTPLGQFARPFDNPDGKPVFAIVLIDTGEATLDRQALANLPFAVTFALDPLAPDTAQHAAIYRAAGQEVVMLATGIAEGSNASDIEVAFQSMAQGLPESVAVMDVPELRFQGNRPLASLVVPVVAAQGRGLLTWDQGLNAADQVARREDLAATTVFRNLDGAGEDRSAIRRYLDRAVFKAGQDGRVTVVGHSREETVAALLEWTVEGRAATVVLAPLSAALTVE
ncbi:divergent polysaccharide deacetylase family protein [Tabrizicola sp.]|uniref:divergent polysaccharide deacetylase family protein n=1 Tax=Tabrizicola sp. TaxID=2005166 RepID=UPI00286C82EC|nr:divergent polysaccharide deacetylase family protein [Tabrizicola sp.]